CGNPKSISYADAVDSIQAAFEKWATILPQRFRYTIQESEALIRMAFVDPKHDFGYSDEEFEEDSIAHASLQYPYYVHFNNRINYTIDDPEGINLFAVAAHEIGHLLQVPHTWNQDSVMNVYYPQNIRYDFNFTSHEIEAIRLAYSAHNQTVVPVTLEDAKDDTVCSRVFSYIAKIYEQVYG
ncbi:matrix metalloproteinase-27-like protein, partial [Leptotrombidium deliense]